MLCIREPIINRSMHAIGQPCDRSALHPYCCQEGYTQTCSDLVGTASHTWGTSMMLCCRIVQHCLSCMHHDLQHVMHQAGSHRLLSIGRRQRKPRVPHAVGGYTLHDLCYTRTQVVVHFCNSCVSFANTYGKCAVGAITQFQ